MANSFNISDKPEIAGVAADIAAAIITINANSSGLATGIISDIGDIDTAISDSQAAVIESITTRLNVTDAKIDVNLAAIDIIDGIADSILALKRFQDYTPKSEYSNIVNNTPVTVLNIASGKGFLIGVCIVPYNVTPGSASVVVTIDGTERISNTMAHTLAGALSPGILPCLHYFDTSLNVTVTLTGDNASYCTVLYLELP